MHRGIVFGNHGGDNLLLLLGRQLRGRHGQLRLHGLLVWQVLDCYWSNEL